MKKILGPFILLIMALSLSANALALMPGPPPPPPPPPPNPLCPVSEPIPVSTCGTIIDKPGYYVLQNDICLPAPGPVLQCLPPTDFGVIIKSDCVTLDLNGHTIGSPVKNLGSGVAVIGGKYVEVKNGVVKDYEIGIHLIPDESQGEPKHPEGIVVAKVRVENADKGIYGNWYGPLKDFTFEGNAFVNNILAALFLFNATNGVIRDNDFDRNEDNQIYLSNSSGIQIEGNRFTAALDRGIFLKNSTDIQVLENAFCGNRLGMVVQGTTKLRVTGNNFYKGENAQARDNTDGNVWDGNFWSDHRRCPNPYRPERIGYVRDTAPLCTPTPAAPACN